MAQTPNLGLEKPAKGSLDWDVPLNNNFGIIDSEVEGLHVKGTANFAGPNGVTITHNLNLSNYMPAVIPTADGDGAIGEIWITDIAANSFVVRNSGSAVTEFTWVIHNRT